MYFTNKRKGIRTMAYILLSHDIRKRYPLGDYWPIIITCVIPKEVDSLVPRAVSLIETNDCPKKAHNSLRVIYEKPNKTKESFAVCHKALRFSVNDLSLRLIEWLELLRILGVSKVFLYSFGVHLNVERVLNYYKKSVCDLQI